LSVPPICCEVGFCWHLPAPLCLQVGVQVMNALNRWYLLLDVRLPSPGTACNWFVGVCCPDCVRVAVLECDSLITVWSNTTSNRYFLNNLTSITHGSPANSDVIQPWTNPNITANSSLGILYAGNYSVTITTPQTVSDVTLFQVRPNALHGTSWATLLVRCAVSGAIVVVAQLVLVGIRLFPGWLPGLRQ
jgi:hypothetical protein